MALRTQFFVLLSAWLELSIANCYFPTRHSSSTGFVFSRVLGFATLTSRPYELHFDFWYGVRKTWDVIDLDNFAEEAQIALATGESFTYDFIFISMITIILSARHVSAFDVHFDLFFKNFLIIVYKTGLSGQGTATVLKSRIG